MANCAWCHKKTDLPAVFAADAPLMEWMEKRIDKYCDENNLSRSDLWGDGSDWNIIKLDEQMEAELLAYDELVASVSKKHICKECLIEDDIVYKKYYLDMDNDNDINITIDDLK